jgi:hypothetical protein
MYYHVTLSYFFSGARYRFVLRPSGDADEKYTFVGECYLHEYMDGEGLIEARKEGGFACNYGDDEEDTGWLGQLHELQEQGEVIPFETREFVPV